jgi:hypothetical protein
MRLHMWEFEVHDWNTLRGFRDGKNISVLLRRISGAADAQEWDKALSLLEAYASDLGVPCEATKDVVACLVSITIRNEGEKRSAILGTLEELTCGRGVEVYTDEQLMWLRDAVRELSYALHAWVHLAAAGSLDDATLAIRLLAYCAVYTPQLEAKVLRYFTVCANERPDLVEELSAVLANAKEVKALLKARKRE